MNPRTVVRMARVLVRSQLRATGTARGGRVRFFRKPSFLLALDVVAFLGSILLGWAYLVVDLAGATPEASAAAIVQGMAAMPFLMTFATVLVGIMFEVNVPTSVVSTDLVNWLPISPSEYVAASASSLAYVYSPLLAGMLGGALLPALSATLIGVWVLMVALSFLGLLTGALVVEVLRAFMNRLSSIMYRRGGRTAMAVRLVVIVLLFAGFQLVFNTGFLLVLAGTAGGGAGILSVIPPMWPSLSVTSFAAGDVLVGILFFVLTVALAAFLALAAVGLRRKYWVPLPVSVKLGGVGYAPRNGILGSLGFAPPEAALIRKDLRALTRRREMAGILALPAIVIVSLVAVTFTEPPSDRYATILYWVLPVMGALGFYVLALGMSSVGQEGGAVWNLYVTPLSPRELVRAKAGLVLVPVLPVAALGCILLILVLAPSVRGMLAVVIATFGICFTGTFTGLLLAMKHPDFSETVRSRFVSMTTGLTAFPLGALVFLAVAGPYAIYVSMPFAGMSPDVLFALASAVSLSAAIGLTLVLYRVCVGRAKRLLQAFPL